MESRAKLFGHSVHQMLVVFPLGLLVMGVIFDIIYKATGSVQFATVAYWNITAGILTGLLAAVFGFVDWLAIPPGTRAKAVGAWHGGGNVFVVALFAANWLLRRDNPGAAPDTLAFVLELLALVGGTITAWLGGELVDRLGVGVDPGAHLDAPNSLSGRPARQP
jgi:uncharacterized membrane protein